MEYIYAAIVLALALIFIGALLLFRRVVPPSEVHVVQSRRGASLYGSFATADGQVYYKWPAALPRLGVIVTTLPTAIFDVSVKGYEGYDKNRVPFTLDVQAFFRIEKFDLAAIRVKDGDELRSQLLAVLEGAVRVTLAGHTLDEILNSRSEFGAKFTEEVQAQLLEWGVVTAKQLELTDIRDSSGYAVISDMMEKHVSEINKTSRMAVAVNRKAAEVAEAEAEADIAVAKEKKRSKSESAAAVAEQEIGVAKETGVQRVLDARKDTEAKTIEVARTKRVGDETVAKEVAVVKAQADAQVTEAVAKGELASERLRAEGITAVGVAQAAAKEADLKAPVNAQILLADKIADSEGYQQYLIAIEATRAYTEVGRANAAALEKAGIKMVISGGTPSQGVDSVGSLFSANGGAQLGALLDSLSNSETGNSLLSRLGINGLKTSRSPSDDSSSGEDSTEGRAPVVQTDLPNPRSQNARRPR